VAIVERTARVQPAGTEGNSGSGSYHAIFISIHRFVVYGDNKARLPYRGIVEGDTRGVIRLTCGSQ
jgi:hypothetical protein